MHLTLRFARSLAALAALVALVVAGSAHADTPPAGGTVVTPQTTAAMAAERRAANALYKEGVRLFNASSFADALDLFEQAYHRYPDARILFSIASTQRQLGKSVAAANSYQRYIDDPGAEPQLAAETRTILQALDVTLGRVEVTFAGDPGELQIADGQWMPAGTKVIRVEPGSFILRGRIATTGATAETTGKVTPGESVPVTLTWTVPPVVAKPPPPKVTPPTTAQPPPLAAKPAAPAADDHATAKYAGYGLGGAAVVFGAAAIILEATSRSKVSSAESACPTLHCSEPAFGEATSDLDTARSRRNLAIVSGGLAAVSLGVGAFLFVRSRATDAGHGPDVATHVVPVTTGNSVGLVLDGRF